MSSTQTIVLYDAQNAPCSVPLESKDDFLSAGLTESPVDPTDPVPVAAAEAADAAKRRRRQS
jgi:hypothetical protein